MQQCIDAPEYGDPRLPERFWVKVKVDPITGCWLWTATVNNSGYAMYFICKVDGKPKFQLGHRVVYAALVGSIPDSYVVDHECHNNDPTCFAVKRDCLHRRCVNPMHLAAKTFAENLAAGKTRNGMRRRTGKCARGHTLTSENTWKDGKCGTCQKAIRNARIEARTGRKVRTMEEKRATCPEGHSMSGENLLVSKGRRYCRTCRRVKGLANWHKRQKAKREAVSRPASEPVCPTSPTARA